MDIKKLIKIILGKQRVNLYLFMKNIYILSYNR